MQKSPTTESLRGVSAHDESNVWASGTQGTYLFTHDGGNTWHAGKVPGAESLDFRGVQAVGSSVFLLASGPGNLSRIYHSHDRGQSWQLQFTNADPKGFFDCMRFIDAQHGIVIGDPIDGKFRILRTGNGGKAWKYVDPQAIPPAVEGESAFAASNSCVAFEGKNNLWFATGGAVSRVFHSSDGGEHWTVVETPLLHGGTSTGIFSIAFYDAQHGVIAGGDYKHPELGDRNLATSDDGGKTWTLLPIGPRKYFSAIRYISPDALIAAGSNVSAFSKDGLQTWDFFSAIGVNALDIVPGSKTVYGVGSDGKILKLQLAP